MTRREGEALLARTEGASGPDREIDLAIATLLWPDALCHPMEDDAAPYSKLAFTASLDDVLALADHILHGWKPGVWKNDEGWEAEVGYPEPRRVPGGFTGYAVMSNWRRFPSAPLALLSALLHALSTPSQETVE